MDYLFLTWRLYQPLPKQPDLILFPTSGRTFVASEPTTGPCWLSDRRIADFVAETIVSAEPEKRFYDLHAWVVMPDHVHLLISPKVPVPLITRCLKASTACYANRLLGRSGWPFWQDDSCAQYLRNPDQVNQTIRYIHNKPVSERLARSAEHWPWSSAATRGTRALHIPVGRPRHEPLLAFH